MLICRMLKRYYMRASTTKPIASRPKSACFFSDLNSNRASLVHAAMSTDVDERKYSGDFGAIMVRD